MEELDLETTNLCTTEDAFEKFQAGAMYEEDEFITLSDIISPPHTNADQDISEILDDAPIGEVPLSIHDEKKENNMNVSLESNQVNDVTSERPKPTTETSAPKRRGRKKKGHLENSNIQPTQCESEFNKSKPKRRGKRITTPQDTNTDIVYVEPVGEKANKSFNIADDMTESASTMQSKSHYPFSEKDEKEVINKTPKKGKRGRKPKYEIQNKVLNVDKNGEILNRTTETSEGSTKISLVVTKTNKHERGRKKQGVLNNKNLVSQEIMSQNCENNLSKKENDQSDSLTTKLPSEFESKKSSDKIDRPIVGEKETLQDSQVTHAKKKKNISDEDIEDLPLSNLNRKSENVSNKNEDLKAIPAPKDPVDFGLDSKSKIVIATPVKKRGRPRKVINSSPTKIILDSSKISDDKITKCDKRRSLDIEQKLNNYDSAEVISDIVKDSEKKQHEVNEIEIKEITKDNINSSTESYQSKRSLKKNQISDYEYNVDNVVKNDKTEDSSMSIEINDQTIKDSSGRPVRRRVLKNWNYDEGSDEDPYANMESSDDEPRRRKKSGRYYSDDEYFPGDKRQLTETESDIAMDEDNINLGEPRKHKKKKVKKTDLGINNKSPRKRGRKSDAESTCPTERINTNTDSRDDDFEDCLDASIIQGNYDQGSTAKSKTNNKSWGKTNEFENVIAKIVQGTDIKISKKSIDNVKAPLQIPVLDASEVHKNIEKSSQTETIKTRSEGVQTDTIYEIPMRDQVALSGEQSEKACELLSNIVRITAELGQLMTQKSEDFITKKINTKYVTDTFKMDYCVKKSFLLFKLAKHNLVQMEEDLSEQYEKFLKENKLIQHREEPKIIASTSKASDSDCEIVEEPVTAKALPKVAFNPKTVFLNKELSIKIAKKPSEEPQPKKKLNIKGRHSVWINDSVVVKKVKTTQSFLAQDSRNKKPPDCKITLEMVNNFFRMYERQKALLICAPFIRTEWFGRERRYMCNYFVDSTIDFPEKTVIMENEDVGSEIALHKSLTELTYISPETLLSLCTKAVKKCLYAEQIRNDNLCDCRQTALYRQGNMKLHGDNPDITNFSEILLISDINRNILCLKTNCHELTSILPLKTICFKRIEKVMTTANCDDTGSKHQSVNDRKYDDTIDIDRISFNNKQILPLFTLCVKVIQEIQKGCFSLNINIKHMPKSLKHISLCKIQEMMNCNKKINNQILAKNFKVKSIHGLCFDSVGRNLEINYYEVKTLFQLSKEIVDANMIKNYYDTKPLSTSSKVDVKLEKNGIEVKTLFQLCKENLVINLERNCCDAKSLITSYKGKEDSKLEKLCNDVKPLSQLSQEHTDVKLQKKCNKVKTLFQLCKENLDINVEKNCYNSEILFLSLKKVIDEKLETKCSVGETLFSTFVESTTTSLQIENEPYNIKRQKNSVMTLKTMCYNKIIDLRAEWPEEDLYKDQSYFTNLNITINDVNTVSDDIFSKPTSEDDLDDDDLNTVNYSKTTYEDEQNSIAGCGINDDVPETDNHWVSQVKMELRSCLDSTSYNEKEDLDQNAMAIKIKVEPSDYVSESFVESSNIKTEPVDDQEYTAECENFSLPNIITKSENTVEKDESKRPIFRSISYDQRLFENFVSSNKMIVHLDSCGTPSNEIFSQSSQRIRRQHEPDSDGDIDTFTDSLNLLVPQNVDKSKDKLLESSSDDEVVDLKKHNNKRSDKRKSRFKKGSKDHSNKGKIIYKDHVAALTKKMKDKIRQELKTSESSDSEFDGLNLKVKIKKRKANEKSPEKKLEKKEEKEIQCNDVDSTEFLTENRCSEIQDNCEKDEDPDDDTCEAFVDDMSSSPLIDHNESCEFLECEPMLSSFLGSADKSVIQKDDNCTIFPSVTSEVPYVERHGWKCYSIHRKDRKIYEHAYVLLDKLPESFVGTYLQYQDVTDKTEEDFAIDRLTNLQTLQRVRKKGVNQEKENTLKMKVIGPKSKKQLKAPDSIEVSEFIESDMKQAKCGELVRSEDESETVPEQIPPVPVRSTENNFARNLLLDDHSDTEKLDETKENKKEEIKAEEQTYKTRSGRKVKCKMEKELFKDDLMLTADKMMNKELALLHAHLKLTKGDEDIKDLKEKPNHTKTQKNTATGHTTQYRFITEDDSSSEEEKQWFTTKEKLLKRLSKKNEDTDMDDAKRAKIVSEFIEKRGELPEKRQRPRAKRRNNKNKTLERRKQLKVLSRELFGVDSVYTKKHSQASTSKGRRNIRKVIDKKSLARSTVVANMEEFERKRRLTIRQAQLREVLGCEEAVNVVVINDELCLEYDFEEKRPVVSVHPFFTKVMKAHQYEGVKFMWDACFESVSQTVEGGAGGGCILAHCMGLGKTLQVLALLHTALTHPQLGMRRVLVCCPLSTVLNWVDEIHKWIGPVTNQIKQRNIKRKLQVFELSKLKKTYERAYQLDDWYNGGGIFIIGYELFRSLSTLDPVLDGIRPKTFNKIRTALLDPGPDIIVCDEGHLLKNDCSILAVAMSRVVTKRRIILTGTPMQNNLREYYCMVNFVKPNLLGSYSEYSNRFENPIMNGQHRDSREEDIRLMKARTHILHKVLEGCLQRQEASVLYPYLPKKHEYTLFIPLTKCQWELYKHYLTHYAKETKQSVLRDFHILQKIWTHPQVLNNFLMKTRSDEKKPKLKVEKTEKLDDEEETPEHVAAAAEWWASTQHRHELNELDSSNKFLVVFRLLDECAQLGDKVLIFSTSLYTMDALEFFLRQNNKWSLGHDYYRLDGSVPAEVRQKWCREFNEPHNTHTKLFLISTRTGSLGLNMTAANRVIILDTSWNPAHDIQSIFRVYRFGQKKDCYIYRLVAMGTMEQKIYERAVTKQAVACRVVDEQQIDRHYNMAELSELYRLDEEGSGVCAGLAAGVRDAALLRVAAIGGDGLHAVHEHDSLLRGSSESVLPEHERNAAWMQFQQEHATTHIQNFEINLPEKKVKTSTFQPKTEEVKIEKAEETLSEVQDKYKKIYKKKSKKQESNSLQELSTELHVAAVVFDSLNAVHERKTRLRSSSANVLPEHEGNAAWTQLLQEKERTGKKVEASPVQQQIEEVKTEKAEETLSDVQDKCKKIYKKEKKNKKQEQEPKPSTSQQELDPKLRVAALGGDGLQTVHEHDSLLRGSSKNVLPEHDENAAWMQFQKKHATTNIKNIEINLPEKKVEALTFQQQIEEVKTDEVEETPSKKILKKGNKNKKQEPKPSTSQQELDSKIEELKVKKIMNILIAHDFHKVKTSDEISDLVTNVRDVVSNTPKSGMTNVDPLIASIARVLIEADSTLLSDENKLTENVEENENNDSDNSLNINLSKRKRRINRIHADEECIPLPRRRKSSAKTRKSNDATNSNIKKCYKPTKETSDNTANKDENTVLNSVQLDVNLEEEERNDKPQIFTEDSSTNQISIQIDDTPPRNEEIYEENEPINKVDTVEEMPHEINEIENDSDSSDECIEVIYNCDDDSDSITEETLNEPITRKLLTSNKSNETKESIMRKKKIVNKDPTTSNVSIISKKPITNNDTITSKEPIITRKPVTDKDTSKELVTNKEAIINRKPVLNKESIISEESKTITDNESITPESIVLSDDDEPIITESQEQNLTERTERKQKSKRTEPNPIPLHQSVLTNKHFIKLVEHSYLNSNPKLDENAATLAAQYSTLKALKEVEMSGKNLTSGPIYDIAVQVLGKSLLKRLYQTNISKDNTDKLLLGTKDLESNLTINKADQEQKSKEIQNKIPDSDIKMTSKRKISNVNKPNEVENNIQNITPQTLKMSPIIRQSEVSSNVVPIGIFKGSAAASTTVQSVEECILPDDDEVILSSSPISSPKRLARRNSQQLIVNAVSSKEASGTYVEELLPQASVSVSSRPPLTQAAKSTNHTTIPSSSIIEANQNKNASKIPNTKKTQESKQKVDNKITSSRSASETICLDSDEEDHVADKNKVQHEVPLMFSDSRTVIISTLDKKGSSNENNFSKIVIAPALSNKAPPLVPTSSLNTSSTSASVDQSKKVTKEINAPIVTKTKCQPGDIIRINESGKVEILKRIKPLVITPGKDNRVTSNNDMNDNVKKIKLMPTLIPLEKKLKESPTLVKESKAKDVPYTSNIQNELDPLSVIRNAVFIPAVTSEETEQVATEKFRQSSEKVTPKKTLTQIKPQLSQSELSKQKPLQLSHGLIKSKPNSEIKHDLIDLDNPKLSKFDANKDGVIDLTNVNSNQSLKVNNTINKNMNEVAAAGSSIATVINKTMLPLAVDPKKTIVTNRKPNKAAVIKSAPTTSKGVQTPGGSKRPSPWNETNSKKIKSDNNKNLTLNDFSLDDIDDIIELE